ncbi:MAG TPA: hypothetical protein VIH35_01345 [Kiritimatiellia bacterium]|jgi:hypothetical protein
MSQEWEIKSCSKVCKSTGTPFADGQAILSRLCVLPEGYVREDYSEAGWTQEHRQSSVSFWKSVFHAPPPPSPEPLKKETAEAMLRQYMAKEDYSRKNAIYILAVMLERKRILVERDVQVRPDGARIRIYEHKKTGEIFTVPDPGLRLDELESVQLEVNEMLGIGPRQAPQPPVSTTNEHE